MVDTAFDPTGITVKRGETIRFLLQNTGKVPHDAFIGDTAAQTKHEQEMADMGGMHHGGHGDAVTIEPGKTGTLTHTFDSVGTTLLGCHQPGHYASGMKLRITVTEP
jgi:uncharacterized cupredoxin-like copper-binding protein